MRASRLVSLLLLLQSRGGQTAAELARELEVSVRTIHRDVDALSASGVPIYADRGPHGGIRLVDGYRTRLTGMTADEAGGAVPVRAARPGRRARARDGRRRRPPQGPRLAADRAPGRASRLVERFHLDAAAWYHAGRAGAAPRAAVRGGLGSQRVQIGYDRGDKTVDRILEPLGLVLKAGVWYLVAGADGQPRTYRVSRVSRVTDARRAVRAARWLRPGRVLDRIELRVRARHAAGRGRPPHRPRSARRGSAAVIGERPFDTLERLDEPDPDGWLRVRIKLDWPNEVDSQILAVGPGCELLEPAELRERIADAGPPGRLPLRRRAAGRGDGPAGSGGRSRLARPARTPRPGSGRSPHARATDDGAATRRPGHGLASGTASRRATGAAGGRAPLRSRSRTRSAWMARHQRL